MKINNIFNVIIFMCIWPCLNAQSIHCTGNKLNLEELTHKFLWEYFFELRDDWDSKWGPRILVEPDLMLYPFMKTLIENHSENSDIISNLPDKTFLLDAVDSFTIQIPDSFITQVVSADEYNAPNMIFPGVYYQLTPLIPTHKEDHYIMLTYSYGLFSYRVEVLHLYYSDESFKLLDKDERFTWSNFYHNIIRGYLDVAIGREVGLEERVDSILKSQEWKENDNTFPEMDSAITEKPEDLLCSIYEHLYRLTPEMEKDFDFLNHINFLNYGNKRLDYLMNYLLKYLPDKFGNHKVYEWDVMEGQICEDKRVNFLEKLPWEIDQSLIQSYSNGAPDNQVNMSMSSIYYTEHHGIIAILDYFEPVLTYWTQIILLNFEYDTDSGKFSMVDSSILFGETQTILYFED